MPLIRVYHPFSLFSKEDKVVLAKQLTALYVSRGLPAFYVNVFFNELPRENLFVGGSPATDTNNSAQASRFVRLVFEHLARSFSDRQFELGFMARVDGVLKPMFEERGLSWEYHVVESPRRLWKIESVIPPPTGSVVEDRWRVENTASAWEGGQGEGEGVGLKS